jgi:hypothetical protein
MTAIGLRDDFDGSALRRLARGSKDGPQARRLLALAEIYDGGSRSDAARLGGVTLQSVRDWVLRFNAHGPAGLLDLKAPGPQPKLNDAQRLALKEIVEAGPIRPFMVWCVGGSSIWCNGCTKSSRSRSTRRRWGGNSRPWAFASSRRARVTMRRTSSPWRHLKKLPGRDRSDPRASRTGHRDRTLVPG